MADEPNKETSISEIELMEAFRGAINNFEARKMTKKLLVLILLMTIQVRLLTILSYETHPVLKEKPLIIGAYFICKYREVA